jgi:hypothetical protein
MHDYEILYVVDFFASRSTLTPCPDEVRLPAPPLTKMDVLLLPSLILLSWSPNRMMLHAKQRWTEGFSIFFWASTPLVLYLTPEVIRNS